MKLASLVLIITSIQQQAVCKAAYADTTLQRYNEGYLKIEQLLKTNGQFKKAVNITESTFQQTLVETEYISYINELVFLTQGNKNRYQVPDYHKSDSTNYLMNRAIFGIVCDTIHFRIGLSATTLLPYTYHFQDPTGRQDWSNTFVSKLFTTRKGNCRSLAYLYKILADELGARCWLALAPGHIYIRNYSRKIGWYNTELTSGTFPTDAWIATTGYVSIDAIRSGIYMDTLSNQQSIALCLFDLAKGYEIQTHNYYDGFILKCCDLVLQYHPVNPMAQLLKAETLKKIHVKQAEEKNPDAATTYAEMEKAYTTLAKLNYREMPEKMYQDWLNSLKKHKDKHENKKVRQLVQDKKTK